MSYLTTLDVFKHLATAQADGIRCAVAVLSDLGTMRPATLRGADVEPEALTVEQPRQFPKRESTGALVERLVLDGHGLVYVLSASTAWGEVVWHLGYAGEPIASVSDVDEALVDGDGIDVRDGELWIESPAGSGLWSFAGVILDSVADAMRRKGLAVA